MAAATDIGGPVGVVTVSTNSPWQQHLLLNEFVRLERTPALLAPGASGRLVLRCRRPIALAATDAAALSPHEPQTIVVDLAFDLRSDDAAVAALVDRLFDEVTHGPASVPERSLSLLLSLRSTAQAQIKTLTRHTDPSVANRARQVLTR